MCFMVSVSRHSGCCILHPWLLCFFVFVCQTLCKCISGWQNDRVGHPHHQQGKQHPTCDLFTVYDLYRFQAEKLLRIQEMQRPSTQPLKICISPRWPPLQHVSLHVMFIDYRKFHRIPNRTINTEQDTRFSLI